jgi:thiamine pyrophosphokinase
LTRKGIPGRNRERHRERHRAIIFANGSLTDPEAARAVIRADDLLIAADGGADYCRRLGLRPHILVGDLDSVTAEQAVALEAAGTKMIRHPARKNETDLELALDHALGEGFADILILAGLGGRWDQTLANLLLPFRSAARAASGGSNDPPNARPNIRLLEGLQEIIALCGPAVVHLDGKPGDIVSLIPVGGDARGVSTSGLEYPLHDEALRFGATRGVSNVLVESQADISVAEGFLICVIIRKTNSSN